MQMTEKFMARQRIVCVAGRGESLQRAVTLAASAVQITLA